MGYESRKWAIWRDSEWPTQNRASFRFYDTNTGPDIGAGQVETEKYRTVLTK